MNMDAPRYLADLTREQLLAIALDPEVDAAEAELRRRESAALWRPR